MRSEPRGPRVLSLKPGQLLCTYGDAPGPLYIVISGRLLVFKPSESKPNVNEELARLGPGAIVGELAAILDQPRTASVGVLEATMVLEVPVDQLDVLTRQNAPVARVIVSALHERAGLSPAQIRDVIDKWGIELPARVESAEPYEIPAPDEVRPPEHGRVPEQQPAPDQEPAPDEVRAPEHGPARDDIPAPDVVPAPEHGPARDVAPARDELQVPEQESVASGGVPADESWFYAKHVSCPVCEKMFATRVVRSLRDQPRTRESDFHQTYVGDFNPYDYELWVCPNDLYAALPADFTPLPARQREPILAAIDELVEREWGGVRPDFGSDRTLILREQSLRLALAICRARAASISRIAALLHRLAWCARERDDASGERAWLTEALEAYTATHEQADKDQDKEDLRVQYLCGELALRLGDRATAHRWFSNALMQPAASKHAMWSRMLREQLQMTVALPKPDAVSL